MSRWIRNALLAVVTALILFWIIAMLSAGDSMDALAVCMTLIGIFFATVAILLWALGLTRLSTARVRERSMIILTYLEQAVRLNLPLTKLLAAAETSEPRWISRSIRRLRLQLEGGASIAGALGQSVPGTSRRNLALIANAERVGRVGAELSYIVRSPRHGDNAAERSFLRLYPVVMICALIAMVSLIMIFVIPRFEQIFHDFRCPMHPLTQTVINFVDLPYPLEMLSALLLLFFVAHRLRRRDWFGLKRVFTSSRDLADVCHVIAESIDAGQPMPDAIRGAADLSISRSLRRKLGLWAKAIEEGSPISDAARAAGMPRFITGLATTKDSFDFLTRYYSNRFSRLMILLRAAAVPGMVFLFGVLVAIVALSLFLPLVGLIDAGAQWTGLL